MRGRFRFVIYVVCFSLYSGISSVTLAQQDEHHELEEVVVSAVPLERTVEQLSQPTSVISSDEIIRGQGASIGELVANEAGVSATYFGPVASRPVIRGQFGERVTVLSNGTDSLDASALSEDHAVAGDSMLSNRIEIVRGPATLLYGSGAAGGIVNVVDERFVTKLPENPFSGTVFLNTDTAMSKRAGALKLQQSFGNFVGNVEFFRRLTDDVNIPDFAESSVLRALESEEAEETGEDEEEEIFGTIENTKSESTGLTTALNWIGAKSNFGVAVNQYDTFYGIPSAGHAHEEEAGDEEEEEQIRIDLDQTRIDVRGSIEMSRIFEVAELKLAHNSYEHVELEGEEIGTVFENDAIDLRLEFKQPTGGVLNGTVGLQYKNTDFNAIGEEAFVPPSETRQVGLFAFEEYIVHEDFVIQGSARLEHQNIDVPNSSSYNGSAFGISLGSLWALNPNSQVAVNVAFSQRHPNTTELYANGPHLAVQRYEIGSQISTSTELEKENSVNIDVTVRGEFERFQWSLTTFVNDINDYIALIPTDQELDELQVFEYRQTDAQLYGAEAELLFDIIELADQHLHTRVFADFVHAEQDNGEYLPRIPALRTGIDLHYSRGMLNAGLQFTHHASQKNIARFELPTESFYSVDAEVAYKFADEKSLLFARVSNLTDEDARRHTSPLKDIAPLPGRSLHIGWRYDF